MYKHAIHDSNQLLSSRSLLLRTEAMEKFVYVPLHPNNFFRKSKVSWDSFTIKQISPNMYQWEQLAEFSCKTTKNIIFNISSSVEMLFFFYWSPCLLFSLPQVQTNVFRFWIRMSLMIVVENLWIRFRRISNEWVV